MAAGPQGLAPGVVFLAFSFLHSSRGAQWLLALWASTEREFLLNDFFLFSSEELNGCWLSRASTGRVRSCFRHCEFKL